MFINTEIEPFDKASYPKSRNTCMFQIRRANAFWIIFFFFTLVYFHRLSTSVLAESMSKDFKVPVDRIMIFSSMYFWSYGILQPFVGAAADLFEIGYLVGVMSFVASVGSLIIGLAKNFYIACIGRFLVGFGCAFCFVPASKIGANWLKPQHFSIYLGIIQAISGIGGLLAQTPLAFLNESFGWRYVCYGLAGLGIISSILSFIFVKGNPASYGYPPFVPPSTLPPLKDLLKHIFSNMKIIAKQRDFWILFVIAFVGAGMFFNLSSSWIVIWLQQFYQFEPIKAANISAACPIAMIVGGLFVPFVARLVHSKKKTMIGCSIIALTSITILFFGDSFLSTPYHIFILVFFFSFGTTSGGPLVCSFINECAEASYLATYIGMVNSACFFGGGFLQIFSSVIFDTYAQDDPYPHDAYKTGLLAVGIAMIIVHLFTIFLIREKSEQ